MAQEVKDKLNHLEQYFPEGIHYNIILDTTEFVDASIDEVLVTFVETTLIVMLIILIFLQNWRTVIIPMLTIPVSLIATFAVMKLMGFTFNTLTLFGLVLAIAIVVDDAIVVVEDCSRLVDQGKLTPREAARKAMVELQGPVIGEVLVLLSVFIPTAFISGITGELYKQFAPYHSRIHSILRIQRPHIHPSLVCPVPSSAQAVRHFRLPHIQFHVVAHGKHLQPYRRTFPETSCTVGRSVHCHMRPGVLGILQVAIQLCAARGHGIFPFISPASNRVIA